MNLSRLAVLALLGACFTVGGCGGPDLNFPDLVPVDGTITQDGQPLAKVRVSFIPTGDTRGQGAMGSTDDQGHYSLATQHGEGAPVGQYKVVLSKLVMPDGSDYEPQPDEGPMDSPAREVLPPRYSNPEVSELTAAVPEGGTTVDFQVELAR